MDRLRTILIIALAVVGYLLILEWNKDYGEQAAITPNPAAEAALEQVVSDLSQTTSGNDALTLETPENLASTSVEQIPGFSDKPTVSSSVIRVETDVLSLIIDLKGGQVIQASLPEYPISLTNQNPLVLLSPGNPRYFVAESVLIGKDGPYAQNNGDAPLYDAANSRYQLADGSDELQVVLSTTRNEVMFEKIFSFKRSSYAISVNYRIQNNGSEPWRGNFAAKLVRDRSPDPTKSGGMGAVSFLGAVLSTPENPYEKLSFKDMEEAAAKRNTQNGWVAFNQHYFVSAWVPSLREKDRVLQTRMKDGRFLMGFVDTQIEIPVGATAETGATLYIGPKIIEDLEKVDPNLALTVDFGWLWLIAKPLFVVLDFIHGYVGNWGIAIILLTIMIKALFFHLSAASYRSMANMRRVAPELTRIRELYGDDRQKMSQAMMDLYRKEKINPLGGCLPILVQMPVFIALYWVLLESVELRQAPFFFWIQDLSIKDPYFILPLLMGASMFVQMKLNPAPPDPVQARVMQLMPVIFTVFFLWFPAGLVLYWLVNNLLSIAQQWVITRQIENAGASAKGK